MKERYASREACLLAEALPGPYSNERHANPLMRPRGASADGQRSQSGKKVAIQLERYGAEIDVSASANTLKPSKLRRG